MFSRPDSFRLNNVPTSSGRASTRPMPTGEMSRMRALLCFLLGLADDAVVRARDVGDARMGPQVGLVGRPPLRDEGLDVRVAQFAGEGATGGPFALRMRRDVQDCRQHRVSGPDFDRGEIDAQQGAAVERLPQQQTNTAARNVADAGRDAGDVAAVGRPAGGLDIGQAADVEAAIDVHVAVIVQSRIPAEPAPQGSDRLLQHEGGLARSECVFSKRSGAQRNCQ